MKDCSAQSDRIAARYGWVEFKKTGDTILMSWRNHYSPKYDRCFIQAFYMNTGKEKDAEIPRQMTELHDAFEFNLLAMDAPDFGPAKTSLFCTIGEKMVPCGKCRQFIEDRMKN